MMTERNRVTVKYRNGHANVLVGSRTLNISRQDENAPEYLCPIELISAAIGS